MVIAAGLGVHAVGNAMRLVQFETLAVVRRGRQDLALSAIEDLALSAWPCPTDPDTRHTDRIALIGTLFKVCQDRVIGRGSQASAP